MALSEQLEALQEQMQDFDINELSLDNIGTWPLTIKIISWVLALVLVIFGGYKFLISDLQMGIERAEQKEITLKEEFKKKAFQAANLDAYRKQMVEMEESFGALISQLPSDTEVPGLLEDITNKGSASGLYFETIDLEPEATKEYYVQLPIKIVATGTYHDIGAFVSGVASLPRIVTLTDFNIKKKDQADDRSNLEITITANTYRYRDLSEAQDRKGKGKGK